jgi:hypothetical protein
MASLVLWTFHQPYAPELIRILFDSDLGLKPDRDRGFNHWGPPWETGLPYRAGVSRVYPFPGFG